MVSACVLLHAFVAALLIFVDLHLGPGKIVERDVRGNWFLIRARSVDPRIASRGPSLQRTNF